MIERIHPDGGTILELIPVVTEPVTNPSRPGALMLYALKDQGLKIKEFGKDAVDPSSTSQAAAIVASAAAVLAQIGTVMLKSGSANPTAAAGVVATIPALYIRTSDGSVWSKTGSGNTAWTQLAFVP